MGRLAHDGATSAFDSARSSTTIQPERIEHGCINQMPRLISARIARDRPISQRTSSTLGANHPNGRACRVRRKHVFPASTANGRCVIFHTTRPILSIPASLPAGLRLSANAPLSPTPPRTKRAVLGSSSTTRAASRRGANRPSRSLAPRTSGERLANGFVAIKGAGHSRQIRPTPSTKLCCFFANRLQCSMKSV